MVKPFNIQAPEEIAKQYAGNKQQIAQAAQMGIVDPTAAVLAGMFIDRMRAAQVMEGGQQPTVAQQVLGGQPTQPPAPAPPAPAGLGATPEATAMPPQDMGMAPPIGMPPQEMAPPMEEMPSMAMGGMVPPYAAGGGLSDMPIPDGMFDEPTNGGFNDGYAGGGMVAFADGGSTGGFGDYIEQMVRKLDPNIEISGRARTPARNAQVGGVANSYHIIDAARDIRTPEGMDKNQFIAQLKSVFGSDYDILPSKGRSVHIEPGPKLGEKARAGARPSGAPSIIPERDINTAEGQVEGVEDIFNRLSSRFGPSEKEKEIDAMRMARAEEMASPEYYEKQRKDSMWETLANIGFNMASSKAPSLLQAIGEAASAALPGAQADKKERKALKDRSLDLMVQLGAKDRKEALPLYNMAVDMKKNDIAQKNFKSELGLKEQELQMRQQEFNTRRYEAQQAAIAAGMKFDLDKYLVTEIAAGGDRAKNANAFMAARYGGGSSAAGRPFDDKLKEGQGDVQEGATAKDTSGKTIVFSNGQWVYP